MQTAAVAQRHNTASAAARTHLVMTSEKCTFLCTRRPQYIHVKKWLQERSEVSRSRRATLWLARPRNLRAEAESAARATAERLASKRRRPARADLPAPRCHLLAAHALTTA